MVLNNRTVLWTNNSPTSSVSGGTDITLSDDMSNYKYLKFEFYNSISNTDIAYTIMSYDEFISYLNNSASIGYFGIAVSPCLRTTYNYVRRFYPTSNTTIRFLACTAINTASTNDTYCIPYKIYGIK